MVANMNIKAYPNKTLSQKKEPRFFTFELCEYDTDAEEERLQFEEDDDDDLFDSFSVYDSSSDEMLVTPANNDETLRTPNPAFDNCNEGKSDNVQNNWSESFHKILITGGYSRPEESSTMDTLSISSSMSSSSSMFQQRIDIHQNHTSTNASIIDNNIGDCIVTFTPINCWNSAQREYDEVKNNMTRNNCKMEEMKIIHRYLVEDSENSSYSIPSSSKKVVQEIKEMTNMFRSYQLDSCSNTYYSNKHSIY